MTGTLPPLLDSVVGGGTPGRIFLALMNPILLCQGKGLVLPNPNVDNIAAHTRFLLLSLPDNGMLTKSPFAINKALIGIGGEPKSVKRLRSGDVLIETSSTLQTKSFLLAKSFLDSSGTISPHKTLNSCRGVISESDLLTTTDAEILDGFSDQDVIQVRRITIKKEASFIPTKHLILTFNRPKLPTTIKAGYLNCKIRPYIPNPLRCFKSHSFGHSQTSCRGQLTCSRCASAGHSSTDCTLEPKSKKLIPPQLSQTYAQATKSSSISVTTQTDENITKIKCPPLNLLPPLSSPPKPNISFSSPTVTKSSSSQAQLLPSISSITPTVSPTILSLSLSDAKENIKQPSQLHRSRKDSKTIDLLSKKPTTNLKKNPAKNTTLKTAREEDFPNESSPVSKRSRRRKTSKTSDAVDTDADPSDTVYVIGLASEENESLLEAYFKKVADNPLTGPLSPCSPKK
ncbi:uncharacterized protein TNCV_2006831 [Trichonephila clavipes]|nr:uncharacterized protein TNCV_2006831 [Trichonephila clavipes]